MEYVKIGGCSPLDIDLVAEFCKEFKISSNLAKILISREINTKELVYNFLNCNNSQLHNPFLLKNMGSVIERINIAKENKEKVVVFGDYDVDGITATYVLLTHLRSLGMNVEAYIPHRIADGYGLTESAISEVKKRFDCSLIITVDCGISCISEIKFANNLGIEVIVTDHHIVPEIKPECLIINPKQDGQDYPFKQLCGAGVALKVVQALSGTETAQKFLSVVAIATIADIVSLTNENRAIVKLGLSMGKKYIPVGIKKLCEISGIKKLTAQNISFKLSPKINAPGRLGDSNLVLKLMLEKNEKDAQKIAEQIYDLNTKRQDIGSKIYDDCKAQISKLILSEQKCFILKDDTWEAGLLGIACAKIGGEFYKPTFLFSNVDGVLKGSVRSISGINIVEALNYAKDYILNFGGHEMAGGLSLKPEFFEMFKAKIEEYLENEKFTNCFYPKMEYDLELDTPIISYGFVKELELLEPTGSENTLPVFKIGFQNASFKYSKNSNEHLLMGIKNSRYLCFNGAKYVPLLESKAKKEAIAEFSIDEFNGKQNVKGIIKHIKCDYPIVEDEICKGYMFYFNSKFDLSNFNFNTIEKINLEKYGNLYVSFNPNFAQSFANKNGFKLQNLSAGEFSGESFVLLCPNSISEFKNYKNIYFIDNIVSFNLAKHVAKSKNVYVLKHAKSPKFTLSCEREIFAKVFKQIKAHSSLPASNIQSFFKKIPFANVSFSEFMFCVLVFEELNFISLENFANVIKFEINPSAKKDLSESKIYTKILQLNQN